MKISILRNFLRTSTLYSTPERPDIVVWSDKAKEVILIELAVGDESNFSDQEVCKEARYNKENEKIMFEREKESVHLSMLDITMEKEQEVPKDHFYFKEQLFHEKSGERKAVSVVRRGTSVTASSKPSFPRDPSSHYP